MRILIVDDDSGTRHALQATLLSCGYQTSTTGFGRQALILLADAEDAGRPYDLVLTDLRMPGMSGIELIRAIREMFPAVPCILMTAYSEEYLARHREFGRFKLLAFLEKPFSTERLLSVIRRQDTVGKKLQRV